MFPHVHAHGLNAEVVQDGGQGVTLSETHIQYKGGAQAAVNLNSSMAVSRNILYQGDKICRYTHGRQNPQKPSSIRFVICFSLVQADDVTVCVGRVGQMSDL